MSKTLEPLPPELTRLRSRALIAGVVATALCALVALLSRASREQFFTSYLWAFIFCLGFALGSLAIVMLHHLVGGHWGLAICGPAEAAALTLPIVAVLFIPIVWGAHYLYDWADAAKVAADPVLRHRSVYMNQNMFILRAAIYFIVWTLLAWMLHLNFPARIKRYISAWGLLVLVVTISLASIDWILSRETHFFSTIVGLLTAVSLTLTAISFLIAILAILSHAKSVAEALNPSLLNDLGNLLLTLVILWAYMSFAQFLIIWMGNISHDTTFYARRGLVPAARNSWRVLGFILIVFHFFLPFAFLLSRDIKRNLRSLTAMAMFVLVLRIVDVFWTVVPGSTRPTPGLTASWMDVLMPIGLFGIWFGMFVIVLRYVPLVPTLEDESDLAEGGAHVQHG